jgi:hypothetical protein
MLLLGAGRAAECADLTVGPGLLRDPVDGVVAVLFRSDQVREGALGEVAAADVLDDDGVAVLDEAADEAGT